MEKLENGNIKIHYQFYKLRRNLKGIVKDGIIELDSEFGKEIGFTSDKFKASWLWKKGNRIIISMIWAKKEREGYFTELIKNIKDKGYEVAIPTPIGLMEILVRKWGFKRIMEYSEDFKDYVEVWVK